MTAPAFVKLPAAYRLPAVSTATAATVSLTPASAKFSVPYAPPEPAPLHEEPLYSYAMILLPLSPETAANIFADASGTIATFDTVLAGLPIEVAASKLRVDDPALVVRLAVR